MTKAVAMLHEQYDVPSEEGTPIFNAAQSARRADRRLFSCAVVVGSSAGSGMGIGGKKTTKVQTWDPSALIEAIEALGWHLEAISHLWEQTEQNNALGAAAHLKGLTRAHLLFRSVDSSRGSGPTR